MTGRSEAVPKMPHRIDKLYESILKHPEYQTRLDEGMRFAFEQGCVSGGSWCPKQNNAWSRKIWKFLYLNEPMKDDARKEETKDD